MACTVDKIYPPQGQPALRCIFHSSASSKGKPLHPLSATEALQMLIHSSTWSVSYHEHTDSDCIAVTAALSFSLLAT